MNIAVAFDEVEQEALSPASEAGPAPKRVVAAYGFWIFILSDIVMFSALFAAYAVLVHAAAGGPTGAGLHPGSGGLDAAARRAGGAGPGATGAGGCAGPGGRGGARSFRAASWSGKRWEPPRILLARRPLRHRTFRYARQWWR